MRGYFSKKKDIKGNYIPVRSRSRQGDNRHICKETHRRNLKEIAISKRGKKVASKRQKSKRRNSGVNITKGMVKLKEGKNPFQTNSTTQTPYTLPKTRYEENKVPMVRLLTNQCDPRREGKTPKRKPNRRPNSETCKNMTHIPDGTQSRRKEISSKTKEKRDIKKNRRQTIQMRSPTKRKGKMV